MNIKELSNDDLNSVSAGFLGLLDYYHGNSVSVSREEYNALKEGHFLTGGKLKNDDIIKAADYLVGKGFKGCLCSSGLVPLKCIDGKIVPDVPNECSEFATLTIKN